MTPQKFRGVCKHHSHTEERKAMCDVARHYYFFFFWQEDANTNLRVYRLRVTREKHHWMSGLRGEWELRRGGYREGRIAVFGDNVQRASHDNVSAGIFARAERGNTGSVLVSIAVLCVSDENDVVS